MMLTDTEREDWAERLAKDLRDHYDAVRNEPIPDRLRELVEQLGRRRSPGTPLDPSRAAPK
jgi:hypothetical protein